MLNHILYRTWWRRIFYTRFGFCSDCIILYNVSYVYTRVFDRLYGQIVCICIGIAQIRLHKIEKKRKKSHKIRSLCETGSTMVAKFADVKNRYGNEKPCGAYIYTFTVKNALASKTKDKIQTCWSWNFLDSLLITHLLER